MPSVPSMELHPLVTSFRGRQLSARWRARCKSTFYLHPRLAMEERGSSNASSRYRRVLQPDCLSASSTMALDQWRRTGEWQHSGGTSGLSEHRRSRAGYVRSWKRWRRSTSLWYLQRSRAVLFWLVCIAIVEPFLSSPRANANL